MARNKMKGIEILPSHPRKEGQMQLKMGDKSNHLKIEKRVMHCEWLS